MSENRLKTNECSTGSHPFIYESSWVGTPWDGSRANKVTPAKSNEELIVELHERLRTNQNVADLFSTSAKVAEAAKRFDPPAPLKKLGKPPPVTRSIQQLADEFTLNPFTEELKASRLPLEV